MWAALESEATAFEASHPGVVVRLNRAGSQVHRLQLAEGAPADVFISANAAEVDLLPERLRRRRFGVIGNRIALFVRKGSGIEGVEELGEAEGLVIGSAASPVGRYARRMLAQASVEHPGLADRALSRVVSEEQNAALLLLRLRSGDAEAALTYRNLGHGERELRVIPLPFAEQARYEAVVLPSGQEEQLGAAFVEQLRSPEGQARLVRWGFERLDAERHGAERPEE